MDTWPDKPPRPNTGQTQDTWPDTRQSRFSRKMLRDSQDSVTTLPPDPLVGKVLDGRYEVQCVIGEGGMGVVYQARHTTLGKVLAIKVLRGDHLDDNSMRRFKQEAQSASAIGHENIVDVMDFGTLPDGATYFVMEHLAGCSLKAALNTSRTPFHVSRAVHVARQICAALAEAHARGVVHRDLKPDNIFLVKRGEDHDFVKVLDFGIAKVNTGTNTLTRAGQVFGTPHYMSPEQCAGAHVDARTDIYALGVILYEMVSGSVPFEADNWMAILSLHLYESPQRLGEQPLAHDVPQALEAVIMKCLIKNPDQRYQSMTELMADLERIYHGVRTPKELGLNLKALQRMSRPADAFGSGAHRPSRWRSVAGALLALSLVGAGVAVGMMANFGAEPSSNVLPSQPPTVQEAVANDNPAAASATVRLSSDPGDAQILESGSLLGMTPLELPRPAAGSYRDVDLRKPGFMPQRVRISSASPPAIHLGLARRTATVKPQRRNATELGAQPEQGTDGLRNPWVE